MFLQKLMKVNRKAKFLLLIIIFQLDTNGDAFKTQLMEKKQQQWKQENCMS
jgi:hypothetical protein